MGITQRSARRSQPADGRCLHALRRISGVAAALLVLVLGGCASLPAPLPRLASQALDGAATPLAQLVAASTPPAQRHLSGLRLLADGDHALDARIALIGRATRSLDVQYYQIASDPVGLRFLRELRDAAARGVRVRLLVDDLYAAGQDPLFAALAAVPRVEVRMFNPLPVRSGGMATRFALSLHQFERINRRMHNKLFIADSVIAVAGGRNIGDEYFMRGAQANFIDMDVLATGVVVPTLAAVFDRYWNSDLAWPIQRLAAANCANCATFDALVQAAAATLPVSPSDRFGHTPVSQQLAAGQLAQAFGAVQVAADDPAKAAGQADPLTTTRAQVSHAMGQAEHEMLIVSPYFVPGSRGMALLLDAAGRHVRTTVLTNSLGATDEPLVHAGYAGYRHAMLKLGVKLHELGARLSQKSSLFANIGSSTGRLHAKVLVIDRQRLVIGSMNMDGRSERHNTEIALLIDSPALASEVVELFRGEAQASSYQLRLSADQQQIEWLADDSGQQVLHTAEPGATLINGLKLALLGAVIDEDLL